MLNAAHWTARLNELATRARVPGATLGIWSDGQEILAAHGVLNSATKVPVTTDSLLQAGSGRWPSFSAAALDAGFRSAFALPLRLREATLGALNLLSVTNAPIDEADIIVARAFADLAALSIVQHRASAEAQRLNEQLSEALTSRIVIEQAKGVIAERAGTSLAEAFSRLRAYARCHNRRLTDAAQAAVDGTLDPLAWTLSQRSQRSQRPLPPSSPRIHRD